MEHLEAGDRLDEFLEDYPTVSRTQAIALLERATVMLVSNPDETAALTNPSPRRLAASFPKSFTVQTVQEMGWAGTENGRLLLLAATEQFDALVTVDQGIEHQQNVRDLPIPVVIMRAARNRFPGITAACPRSSFYPVPRFAKAHIQSFSLS